MGKMLRRTAVLLPLMILLLSVPAHGIGSVSEAKSGVVRVLALTYSGGEILGTSIGSGFGVGATGEATDVFITNRHVVEDLYGNVSGDVYILLDDHALGLRYDEDMVFLGYETDFQGMARCEVLWAPDDYPDLAVLRTEDPVPGRAALPLLEAERAADGSPVYAIGYPASADGIDAWSRVDGGYLQSTPAGIRSSTITQGVIQRSTKLMWRGDTKIIQHSAHIDHGDSGGPLVTAEGAVIGIDTYGYGGGDGGTQYDLAIYIDYAMEALDALGIPWSAPDPDTPDAADGASPTAVSPAREDPTPAAPAAGTISDGAADVRPTPTPVQTTVPSDGEAVSQTADQDASSSGASEALQEAIERGQERSSKRILTVLRIAAVAACVLIAAVAAALFLYGRSEGPDPGEIPPSAGTAPSPAPDPPEAPAPRPEDALRLQCVSGTFVPRRFAIADPTRIGRDPTCNDLVYPQDAPGVSGIHCRLGFEDGALYLQDLKSTYGTWYRGRRLDPMEKVRLREGDEFCLGRPEERFRISLSGQR